MRRSRLGWAPGNDNRGTASDRPGSPDDPGLANDARDLELPPRNKGRYGTALGRAVHGMLQSVELATGEGLEAAVAAQVLAEGVAEHADVVAALTRSALDSDVVQRAASRPHWRETYVGSLVTASWRASSTWSTRTTTD